MMKKLSYFAAAALYLAVARMVPYGVGIWCHEDDVLQPFDLLGSTLSMPNSKSTIFNHSSIL